MSERAPSDTVSAGSHVAPIEPKLILPPGFALESRPLRSGGAALMLADLTRPEYDPLVVDFLSGQLMHRLKTGLGKTQSMSKALGLKSYRAGSGPRVLDATAGMGTDSFIMSAMGCEVRAVERSPVIYALLRDGWERLRRAGAPLLPADSDSSGVASRDTMGTLSDWTDNDTSQGITGAVRSRFDLVAIAARLSFENAVSHDVLQSLISGNPSDRPQIVYLDPMYPDEGRSKSALPKKEMQIFRSLLGDDNDTELLFELAMNAARERVVVKRPSYAPVMGKRAAHSFESKTARFDMYLVSPA